MRDVIKGIEYDTDLAELVEIMDNGRREKMEDFRSEAIYITEDGLFFREDIAGDSEGWEITPISSVQVFKWLRDRRNGVGIRGFDLEA